MFSGRNRRKCIIHDKGVIMTGYGLNLKIITSLTVLCILPLHYVYAEEALKACARVSSATEYISCPEDMTVRVQEKKYPSPALIEKESKSLHIYGVISTKTVAIVEEALRDAPPFFPVYIDSPGGSPGAAIQIGRMLRDKNARTLLKKDALCVSACNFIFMGGKIRKASADAVFGSHAFDIRCMKREHQYKIAQMAEHEARYAFDMGVSKCFLPEIMFNYRRDQVYCSSPEQMYHYNIDNTTQLSEGIMPACKAETKRLMAEIKQIGRSVKTEAKQGL